MDYQIVTKPEGDDRVFEIRAGETVLGTLRCRWRKRILISQLEIAEDHRREGLGSTLMHELVKQAISEKADCIECFISQQTDDGEYDVAYFLWRCGLTPWLQEDEEIRYVLWLWNDDAAVQKASALQDALDIEDDQDLDDEDLLLEPEDEGSGNGALERESALNEDPQIDPLGPEDLICGRCLYRLDGPNSGECHKYSYKPDEVFTEDRCEYYTG